MDLVLVASFLLFMCAFAGIGLASMWVKEDTTDDYLVAGRGMHPALAALSAVCLLYTSPSPRDATLSRMPSSA